MKEKMKSPKTKDGKAFSNDVECVLIGLMLILLSIIGLLNKGPVGNFFKSQIQIVLVFVYVVVA